MKIRLHLQVQIFFGLMIALFIGYILKLPVQSQMESPIVTTTPDHSPGMPSPTGTTNFQSTPSKMPTATQDSTPRPFVTLSGVWSARIRFYPSKPPEVVYVRHIPQGRLTVTNKGKSQLKIFNQNDVMIYGLDFQPDFSAAVPNKQLDEIEIIFVLPVLEGNKYLQVITPNGEVKYEFPSIP